MSKENQEQTVWGFYQNENLHFGDVANWIKQSYQREKIQLSPTQNK